MKIRPRWYLVLALVAAFVGCGSEPAVVEPQVTPAVADSATKVATDDLEVSPAGDDPFLSDEMPSGNEQAVVPADAETAPDFEELPDENFEAANDADDTAAVKIPDADEIALTPEDESETEDDVEETDEPRYERRKIHDPDGIGKFYMGREIAHVMGYQAAPWLERINREEEERLSLLMKALDLQSGQVVADIGAGSGVITLMMAEQVGPEGQIIAVDVQQKMLDLLKAKLKRFKIKNVKLVKGTQRSPKLEPESIDLAIMVDVYHEFEFPYEMLLELSKALKPGGAIAFVEYRLEDPTVPIKLVHKMSVEQVKLEAEQPEFGLKYRETIDILPRQHIIIFERSQELNDKSPEPEGKIESE